MYVNGMIYASVFRFLSVIRADSFGLSWCVFAIIQFINVLTKHVLYKTFTCVLWSCLPK